MRKIITTSLKWVIEHPRWTGAATLLILFTTLIGLWPSARANTTFFTARRGPLLISVVEGGSIEALESQVIRSRVEGREGTKILRIVEEGYQVTAKDLTDRLVLVELDASALKDRITSQEIDFQATLANLTESIKQKEVQENRNLSDIKTAGLARKFALMDFKKYLGEAAASEILEQLDLNEESVNLLIQQNQEATQRSIQEPNGNPGTSPAPDDPSVEQAVDPGRNAFADSVDLLSANADAETLLPQIRDYDVDFGIFASDEREELLGNGQARQELRKLKDDVLIAEAEYALQKKAYEGATRLAEEGYLTSNELEQKKITFEKSDNALQSARATLALFKTYDLQKTAEQFLLDYEKALLELARVRSDAVAELSDCIEDLKWARRRHQIERNQLEDLYTQLSNCVIRAERQGLVVYGEGREEWDRNEIIREGATVRERQAIITIPDMRNMALTVRIHESQIKRVRVGQTARLTVDAEPDRPLAGLVSKVAVLPDSENLRFNPDQKVYKTTITVDGLHEWLKPGMNAKAEIVVNELEDVVYFPLHALFPYGDGQACYIRKGLGEELRTVEVIDYNNRFAAVQSGVVVGEAVLLDPPRDLAAPPPEASPVPETLDEDIAEVARPATSSRL